MSTPGKPAPGKPAPASQRDLFRTVPTRLLTPVGWLRGTFVVPRIHLFLDHVNTAGPFLRLHDVDLPGRKDTVGTFVVGRDAILGIVPENPDRYTVDPPNERMVARRISCMLKEGVIHGHLLAMPDIALESYLLHHSGFVVLAEAVLLHGTDPKPLKLGMILLNAGHVVGVSQTEVLPLVPTPSGLRIERRATPRKPKGR